MCIDITIDIESFYTELRIGVVFNSIVSILLVLLPFLAILLVSRVSHFELVGFWFHLNYIKINLFVSGFQSTVNGLFTC